MPIRQLRPLRTTTGSLVPLRSVALRSRSDAYQEARVADAATLHEDVAAALANDFRRFLPGSLRVDGLGTFARGAGAERWPAPPDPLPPAPPRPAPVAADLPTLGGGASRVTIDLRPPLLFASLQGLAQQASDATSRDFHAEVVLTLARPTVVGGIVYAGLPYVPYYVTEAGENSANFGLPRELRLSWGPDEETFLDDERSLTVQETASHAGVHVLSTGPVLTDRLVLRLADFPRFLGKILGTSAPERHGFALPFLAVFQHREGTRQHPRVPLGLLAATAGPSPPDPRESYPIPAGRGRPCADRVFYASSPVPRYFPLTAAAACGAPRLYHVEGAGAEPYKERFVSTLLHPGDALVLHVEQAEERPRCVAGLRVRWGTADLPGVPGRPSVTVEVYELDPLPGVSPLRIVEPADDKYATKLGEERAGPVDRPFEMRFSRPSQARHFAIVLRHRQGARGAVCIRSMELVQSARVAVAPRASRTQRVEAMRFRLVGEELARDYATIGGQGFGLRVEHVVGGQTKQVLFAADSLLDLVESGAARLLANQRFEETVVDVSRETVATHDGGYEQHTTKAWTEGWRTTETGEGVQWNDRKDPVADAWKTADTSPTGAHGFQSIQNAESRALTEHVGHEGVAGMMEKLKDIVHGFRDAANAVPGVSLGFELPELFVEPGRMQRQDVAWQPSWKDVGWRGVHGLPRAGLVSTMTVPPHFALFEQLTTEVANFATNVKHGVQNLGAAVNGQTPVGLLPNGPDMETLGALVTTAAGPAGTLLNGASVGVSGSAAFYVGGSLSLSGGALLPALSYAAMRGTAGTITKNASLTGYSYHQGLHEGFDRNRVHTTVGAGEVTRDVTRRLHRPGTVRERRHGADVMWQGRLVDIVSGSIALDLEFPATAGPMYHTTDEALVVRFTNPAGGDVAADVWFDVDEEVLRDED